MTPLVCAGQGGHGAFPDEIAFELCKRTHHVQEKLTCSCSELRISDAQLDNSAWFLLALGLSAIFGEVESTGTTTRKMERLPLGNSTVFLTLSWTGKRWKTSKQPRFTKYDTAGEVENAREAGFSRSLHEPKGRDFPHLFIKSVVVNPNHGDFASSIKYDQEPLTSGQLRVDVPDGCILCCIA